MEEIGGTRGSATVEAAMILPFFLCAVCTISVIAQFLLAEASIYHAMIQTARVYAKQETCKSLGKEEGQEQGSLVESLGGFVQKQMIFSKYLEEDDVPSDYVAGGKGGILIQFHKDGGYVNVTSQYLFRVPVPFFQNIMLPRTLQVKQRMYTGYIMHDKEQDYDGDEMIYVTKYGEVYHTDLSCHHLSIQITDQKEIQEILKTSRHKKCEKCISGEDTVHSMYITKEGDCYHASLSCSGLKREIVAVKKSEISGKRLCSACAKK